MLPPVFYKIITSYVNPLIYVLFALAMLYFLWGVYQFIRKSGEPSERTIGAKHLLWSLVGFAIMMSAFVLVRMVMNTIGVPEDQRPNAIEQLR